MAKYLKLYKNNTEISGKTYSENVDKLSEILPEVNYNLLSSVIILSQGMPNKFSSFNPSGRKELLEKLTKSDFMIEDIKSRVANRQSVLNTNLRSYEDTSLVANTELNQAKITFDEAIKRLALAIKPDYATEKSKLQAEIELNTANKQREEALLATLNSDFEKANSELLDISSQKSKDLEKLFTSYSAKVSEINERKTACLSAITALKKEIATIKNIKDVCPTCGQKIPGVNKPSCEKQEEELKKYNETLTAIQQELTECDNKNTEFKKEIDADYAQNITELTTKANSIKTNISNTNLNINNALYAVNAAERKIVQITVEETNWEANYTNIKKTVETTEAQIKALTDKIVKLNELKTELNDRLAIIKKMESLIKRDFRGFLLSNIIVYINQKAKDYCEIVYGTRELEICLDGNALDISYNGKLIDNLSGGEKTRVDLILQLALRNTLISFLGFNSNLIVLDEITDFLDKKSCKAVMELLTQELNTTESVFIVSHHVDELELPIDTELQVIKTENGISEVLN